MHRNELLTGEPCLAHYAKDKDNNVTTDASKTGFGITLRQKQSDGEIKPIAFGSRYLNKSEKELLDGGTRITSSGLGPRKVPIFLYGKKSFL